MHARTIAVLGGGPAGMATALLLARQGHAVTLVERDEVDATDPAAAFAWVRRGIPHFLQPHALIPRARSELLVSLPDIYSRLVDNGADDVDLRRKMPGGATDSDDDLAYVAVRRPLIEWALRSAVDAQAGLQLLRGTTVTGVGVHDGRVVGVSTGSGDLVADLVVDAMGRRTPMPRWLSEHGLTPGGVTATDCGVVYYSRYYRVRPGRELPDGPWLLSPRGDLGYLGFASFPGDNRTFGALFAVPSGVEEWRALRDAAAFSAAAAQIPLLRQWLDDDLVEPITPVLAMAGLRNTLTDYDPTAVPGLVPVGDSLAHTDPVLAHGLAFGFIEAAALAEALSRHGDTVDACSDYLARVEPALRERFAFASALDEERHRMWTGGAVDFAHPTGDYALFSMVAAGAAAMVDAEVFRVFVRRIGLLDSTGVLDDDDELQRRIEATFAELTSRPRPAPGPAREEMVALLAAAGA